MQTQEKTERFFSIELNSKHQIKNMTLTNNGQKESTLIEGTIGNLVEASFTEGIILEVTGTKGVLRLDLQEQEIKQTILINKQNNKDGTNYEKSVVYYSRTGKTKFVAETIAAELGSEIEEIVDLKNREGKLGWMSATQDASSEKETHIAPTKKIPKDYDLLIIGTPVWAFNTTPAIRTYIKNNDLSGKKWRCSLLWVLDLVKQSRKPNL